MLHRLHLLIIAGALFWASTALACPDCATARAARGAFFDERFPGHLALALLPLLVLGVIVSLLYRIGLERRENEGGGG